MFNPRHDKTDSEQIQIMPMQGLTNLSEEPS